jgi:hypothetical protein
LLFRNGLGAGFLRTPRSFHETYFEDLRVGIIRAVAKEVLEEVPIGYLPGF